MADGILIDPGTTTEVATDDCGASGHAQVVKLAVDVDGDATLIDLDGLLTSIKTAAEAIQTAVETLDNVVAGTEAQVDIVSAPTLTVDAHAVTNAGTFAVQDSEKVADDAAFTPATTKVLPAGFFADETSTDSVDEGDAGAARMTLDRRLIVVPQPHAAGGCDTFHSNDLDETEEDVKTSAGTVYGWIITNRTAAAVYVHFYNAAAASVTVGTTAPLFIFAVPGNSSDYVAAHLLGGVGIKFDTAISVAATTDFPDDGGPAGPAANGVVCTVFYK